MRQRYVRAKAYSTSVVLGGGLVLHPIENPDNVAAILNRLLEQVDATAYEAGKEDAQAELRKAIGLP